jgi:hypothetical protein
MASSSIIYYTDNRLDSSIANACREQLEKSDLPIVYVSLGMAHGFHPNVIVYGERGPLTMFHEILAGLEHATTDIVFFAEHDCLYAKEHFSFTPPDPNKVYYNLNVFQVRSSDGHVVFWQTKKVSQLCAHRGLLIEHYRKRIELVEKNGFSMKMGYEPGTNKRKERVDDLQSDTWWSDTANIDIRHDRNLSKSKWSPDDFRDKRTCIDWKESDSVPGWGRTEGRFWEFLASL